MNIGGKSKAHPEIWEKNVKKGLESSREEEILLFPMVT